MIFHPYKVDFDVEESYNIVSINNKKNDNILIANGIILIEIRSSKYSQDMSYHFICKMILESLKHFQEVDLVQ